VQTIVVVEKGFKEGARWCVGVRRVADMVVNVSGADGGGVGGLMVEECVEEVSSEEASRT
jgi:hypothetical protein